jgi:hypothetical protein
LVAHSIAIDRRIIAGWDRPVGKHRRCQNPPFSTCQGNGFNLGNRLGNRLQMG